MPSLSLSVSLRISFVTRFSLSQDDVSGSDGSGGSDSDSDDEGKADQGGQSTVDEDDDEAEWEKFQKRMNK